MRIQGRVAREPDGELVLYAVVSDVTAELRDQRERSWQNERYRLLSEMTHKMSFDYDSDSDTVLLYMDRTGKGMDGLITVTLLVEDNHITCIETTQEGESQSVGGYEAIRDGVYANMIDAAQGSDIDAVSGATITTAGIRQAVEAALAQARA